MQRLLLALIRFYQRGLSPVLGARCRFEPTCSQYAYEAIAVRGSARGVWLALKRLSRCRPGHPGGYDPVPERCGHEHREARGVDSNQIVKS